MCKAIQLIELFACDSTFVVEMHTLNQFYRLAFTEHMQAYFIHASNILKHG